MDVDRIREALAEWESPLSLPGRGSREDAGDVLAEAARLVVEAPERDWCELHFCVGQENWCWAGVAGAAPRGPCRMVPARLLVPPKEKP